MANDEKKGAGFFCLIVPAFSLCGMWQRTFLAAGFQLYSVYSVFLELMHRYSGDEDSPELSVVSSKKNTRDFAVLVGLKWG